MDYVEANAYLGNKSERPMPEYLRYRNHTRLIRVSDDAIAIRQHDTNIVIMYRNGAYELNSGGWRTVTTKARLNQFTPFRIYSKNRVWYVYQPHRRVDWDEGIKFFDGMKLSGDCTLLNPPNPKSVLKQEARQKKLLKNINDFIAGYIKTFSEGMSGPSGGDCWFCAFVVDEGPDKGKSWGDLSNDDHLVEHMKQKYYVPSIVVNAMREQGYRDVGIGYILNVHEENGELKMGGPTSNTSTIRRTLRRYMLKRLTKELAA